MTIRQLEAGKAEVENQYPRVVSRDGNRVAQDLVNKVFEVGDRKWRGVGSIPKSGYKLRYEFHAHDAERLFDMQEIDTKEPEICISGLVLRGVKKPHDCPAFGTLCNPERPLGATMVSAEGACAAYYAYGRHLKEPEICISGLVLRGVKKPHDCPAFGTLCTPEKPLGATMVSAEGACAAYYAYGRHLQKPATAESPGPVPYQDPVLAK